MSYDPWFVVHGSKDILPFNSPSIIVVGKHGVVVRLATKTTVYHISVKDFENYKQYLRGTLNPQPIKEQL